jgi:SAM-dependent methyltransferase
MTDEYDDHPYTEHAYAETHPSRVAALAHLSGWEAPRIERARVLELGCGRGGNLLPMAAGLREATFVGVDLSPRQIDEAQRVAAGAGLSNVTFVRASFDDFYPAAGSFDYVVCHGVLSWVAPGTRTVLLERIGHALAPAGVAHVSFNVLPGWYDRLIARDWLRFAASSLGVVAERAAESLRWLHDQASPEQLDYRRRLAQVARRLGETDSAYARHEYLASEHHPLLVGTLLDEAAAAGLTYLGDAIPATTALELLPDDARRRASSLGVAEAQQLVDFVRCTAFRRTLLVRCDEARARSWRAPLDLARRAPRSLFVASRLRPEGDVARARTPSFETFGDGAQTVQVSDVALRRALHELARVAPRALSFEELARQVVGGAAPANAAVDALGSELVDLWLSVGAIDLLSAPPTLSTEAAERPIACPLARWQASHGRVITNRLHQEVEVPDTIVRWVLPRLDGTRTRHDLARDARSLEGGVAATSAELDQVVCACLDRLVACALVVPQ